MNTCQPRGKVEYGCPFGPDPMEDTRGRSGVGRSGRKVPQGPTRRTRARRLLRAVALLSCCHLHAACSSSPPQATESPHPALQPTHYEPNPEALALMAADYFEGAFCQRLEDRFLPLPEPKEEGRPVSSQPPGAAVPAAGRLWITGCRVQRESTFLHLSLKGLGWIWVDTTRQGFRVRQYVGFETNINLSGVLTPYYEPAGRVATFWFIPSSATAPGSARGALTTKPDTFLASILGIFVNSDAEARKAFDAEVARRFVEKLNSGFTVTYNLATKQIDFALGQLPPGQEPIRAFSDGRTWLVNEQIILHPELGGVHVTGPFDPATGVDLDLAVYNHPIRYWTECVDVTKARFSALWSGGTLPSPDAAASSSSLAPPGLRTIQLATPNCRWTLLTAAAGTEAHAFIRVRGTPRAFLTPASAGGYSPSNTGSLSGSLPLGGGH